MKQELLFGKNNQFILSLKGLLNLVKSYPNTFVGSKKVFIALQVYLSNTYISLQTETLILVFHILQPKDKSDRCIATMKHKVLTI